MATVRGIDVNDGRGDVDWPRVVAEGYRFAFVKASEGLDYRDKLFGPGRWQAMRKAKVIRGAYHYARPQAGRRGRDEAAFFLSVVEDAGGLRAGDLPLCLDIEWPDCKLSAAEIRAWCSDFCATVKRATGRPCLTYTGNFWRDRVGTLGPPGNGAALWLPAYGPNDGTTRVEPKPFVPKGFRLRFHQWTDKGRTPGVQQQPVDQNVWLGTLAELKAFCRAPAAAARPRARRATPAAPAPPAPPAPAPAGARDGRMSTEDIQRALKKIGWPLKVDGDFGDRTAEALRDFQRGYALEALRASGKPGPKTNRALRACASDGGRCSQHFAFKEFRSKGNGWIKVDRELVRGLERYRAAVGAAVSVVSGYRDPAHNAAVGGASQSQHVNGNGVDVAPVLSVPQVRALRAFSGIGYQGATGLVRHVDVRHRGPNTTGGTVAEPTTWVY